MSSQASPFAVCTVMCVACARPRASPAHVTSADIVCPSNTTTGETAGQATQRPVPNAPSRYNEPLTDSKKHHYTTVYMAWSASSITQAACATLAHSCSPPQQHHLVRLRKRRSDPCYTRPAEIIRVHRCGETPSYGGLASEALALSRIPPARVTRADIVCPSNTTTGATSGKRRSDP